MEDNENEGFNDADIKVDKNNYNIALYVSNAKKFPRLEREEEKEIAIKALAGDGSCRKQLVQSNLLLVVKIAHEYKGVFSNLNDLIQEGNVGLLRSIDKFDPNRGNRFSTYAGWWIRSLILRYIFNNSHMIKPGTTNEQKKLFYNLRREQKRLESLGIDADTATIALNLDVSEKDVVEMDGRLKNDIYLDTPISGNEDDGRRTLGECLASVYEQQPDVAVENRDYLSMLRGKLDVFAGRLKTDRHREIFYRRVVAEDPETLQKLGDEFGITKERCRQIEEEMLLRLKKYIRGFIEV